MENQKEVFRWKFKGELDGVPLKVFLASMKEFGAVLEDINAYAGNDRLDLNIKAAGKGSFWIDFGGAIITTAPLLMPFISNIDDLLKAFSSYIKLVKLLKGGTPGNVSSVNQDGEIVVHAPNNSGTISVSQNTYNFYVDNAKSRDNVFKGIEPLKESGLITGVEIAKEGLPPFLELDRAGIEEFSKAPLHVVLLEQPELKREKYDSNVLITIIRLEWGSEDAETLKKWGFVYRGHKISASINDDGFCQRVNGGERFAKGDKLIVSLSYFEVYDQESKDYLIDKNSYKILSVLEHREAQKNENLF